MKFSEEKKQAIRSYILEKISEGRENLSSSVREAFGISTNTYHNYIRELTSEGIIQKNGQGKYELITKRIERTYKRSRGEFKSDTYAFDDCLEKEIANLGRNIISIWSYAFSEMANNVIDHSEAENMHITIEKSYLYTTVIMKDDGVGIFNKIQKHFSLDNLDEAICELFKGKLTTDENNHSGEGIFFSSRMMDKFFIISDGKIFSTSKYNIDDISDIDGCGGGTCVYMTLSNFTKRTAKEVFDAYADVDNGFTRTMIPMKNIFDSSPISRSQAKRLCNRLDKFEEVVLDFDEVEWMGQGFAHQIFVVFAKNNPQIKLVAENMSESVEKMYLHVKNSQ